MSCCGVDAYAFGFLVIFKPFPNSYRGLSPISQFDPPSYQLRYICMASPLDQDHATDEKLLTELDLNKSRVVSSALLTETHNQGLQIDDPASGNQPPSYKHVALNLGKSHYGGDIQAEDSRPWPFALNKEALSMGDWADGRETSRDIIDEYDKSNNLPSLSGIRPPIYSFTDVYPRSQTSSVSNNPPTLSAYRPPDHSTSAQTYIKSSNKSPPSFTDISRPSTSSVNNNIPQLSDFRRPNHSTTYDQA